MSSIIETITRPPTVPQWRRTLRHADLWGLVPAFVLAAVMIWCVTHTIYGGNWAAGLFVLSPIALVGLLLGALIGHLTRLNAWIALLMSMLAGVVWSVEQLGALLDERLTGWPDYASELLIRSIIWGRIMAAGERGEDIILFVTALALLSWALGYSTAWMLFRLKWTWTAIVLNSIVILVNYTFVLPKPTVIFFLFLTCALLLVVQQNISQKQHDWRAAQIEFPDTIHLRFLIAAVIVCGVLTLITGMLPGQVSIQRAKVVWSYVSEPGQALRRSWEDAFSTINAPPGTVVAGFSSRNAELSGPRVLGDDLVMVVRSSIPDYWRAVARDRYDGHSWENTTGERARVALGVDTVSNARTALDPGQLLPRGELNGRLPITQTFELNQNRTDDFLFVGGDAQRLTLPALVEHTFMAEPGTPAVPIYDDLAAILSRQRLAEGSSYSVESLVSIADEQSLRAVGTQYPNWVRERYFQLPDTVTERTRALARQIVTEAGATNPYDQAIAIQRYLRQFPYNERINAPPAGVDAVDYFLFDVREGYCDYYASAMAVMLRSLDIPVRWVNGYATGDFNAQLGGYEVRSSIAHTWPEVYFPGFGWLRFEPTPASYTSVPARPLRPIDPDAANELFLPNPPEPLQPENDITEQERRRMEQEERDQGTDSADTSQEQEIAWSWLLVSAAALVGLLGGSLALVMRRNAANTPYPATAAYGRIALLGRLARLPHPAYATPHEYQELLAKALPAQRKHLATIVAAYLQERYRGGQASIPRADIEGAWRRLRWPLIRLVLRNLGTLKGWQARNA